MLSLRSFCHLISKRPCHFSKIPECLKVLYTHVRSGYDFWISKKCYLRVQNLIYCLYFGFLSDCLDAGIFRVMSCWYSKPALFPSLNWFSNSALLLGKFPCWRLAGSWKGRDREADKTTSIGIKTQSASEIFKHMHKKDISIKCYNSKSSSFYRTSTK